MMRKIAGCMVFNALALLGCAGANDASESSGADLTAVADSDLVGAYTRPAGAFLMEPLLKDWGGHLLLSGHYAYGDELSLPVEYVLARGADGRLTGATTITVRFGSRDCTYPVSTEITAGRDDSGKVVLFVRENLPASIPGGLEGGRCPQIANAWFVSPTPFVKQRPSARFGEYLILLCTVASDRAAAVDRASSIATGPLLPLPRSVFEASGNWEAYSTPVRDLNMRRSWADVADYVKETLVGPNARDIARDFEATWDRTSRSCEIDYKASNGAVVAITLADVQKRLFDLSFDPSHCPEMRWGAFPNSPDEYASCSTKDAAHEQRFRDEASMRNLTQRPPAGTPTPIGFGPPVAADIDFPSFIRRVAGDQP